MLKSIAILFSTFSIVLLGINILLGPVITQAQALGNYYIDNQSPNKVFCVDGANTDRGVYVDAAVGTHEVAVYTIDPTNPADCTTLTPTSPEFLSSITFEVEEDGFIQTNTRIYFEDAEETILVASGRPDYSTNCPGGEIEIGQTVICTLSLLDTPSEDIMGLDDLVSGWFVTGGPVNIVGSCDVNIQLYSLICNVTFPSGTAEGDYRVFFGIPNSSNAIPYFPIFTVINRTANEAPATPAPTPIITTSPTPTGLTTVRTGGGR